MIIDFDIFRMRFVDKEEEAIAILREAEPPEGYYVAYSGGKDSTVILDLVRRSGVKYDAHYNVTTVDPPELVQFVRQQPDVIMEMPEVSMRNLIIKKGMPPTRRVRYCCEYLKEHGGSGRCVVTGVRAAESLNRKKRRQFEGCSKDGSKSYVHLIFHWQEDEVWEYINSRKLSYCSLYDEVDAYGAKRFKRLGCIGCPMAGGKGQKKEADRWPNYKRLYVNAFQEMIDVRKGTDREQEWQTGEEVWDWWTSPRKEPSHEGQTQIFE